MDDQHARFLDDLRDFVTGEVYADDLTRAAYATDASIVQIRPLAVVAPASAEEAAAVVRHAVAAGISIHPRGGGTGMAGESLGPGIVLDMTHHLNRILQTGRNTVRVEPGLALDVLQAHLGRSGRMLGPDPVSGQRCTIGGMIATDAGGPHSLRYGTMRQHVLALRVILADGEIIELGCEPLKGPAAYSDDRRARLAEQVGEILDDYSDEIVAEQPPTLPKPGGFCLRGVLVDDTIDFPRLLVGSEGTLGIVVEAVLSTLPLPAHRGVALACFTDLESAAHAVLDILEYQPTAAEMLDRRLAAIIRELDPRYERWIPAAAEAIVLIEQEGSSENNVLHRLKLTTDRLRKNARLMGDPISYGREPERSLLWAIRNLATPNLARASGATQPVPFIENTAVPPLQLPRFLRMVQDIMKRHEVTASYSAHPGAGILHARPLLDLQKPADRAKLESIAFETFDAVISCGGTFNGEHGCGILRSGFLPRQYPKLYPAFCKVKAVFDPQNSLNPGRIVGAEAVFPRRRLRTHELPSPSETTKTLLRWEPITIAEAAERCNGCGACESLSPTVRMCPIFKVDKTELASPRAKANLLRQIFSGDLDADVLAGDSYRDVADLCVNCKMCRVECPSGVDISKLMIEAKAANVAEHGLRRTDWFFSRLERWSRWASANSLPVNAMLGNRAVRWMIERFWGVSRRRRLIRFHRSTFLRRATRHGWTKRPPEESGRPRVVFFADSFVNYNDPQLGEIAVRLLEHLGVRVYVPPTQRGSGMAPLTYGDVDAARAIVENHINTFAELVRDGFDIVTPEPSAALMFRDDARNLVSDPDLEMIARHTFELGEYLAVMGRQGKLREGIEPTPLTVGLHVPCHQKALLPRAWADDFLGRIPGLSVTTIDRGCSGMAGTFGLRAASYDTSLAAGSPMLTKMNEPDLSFGAAECSACRMQIEQATGKRAIHPAVLLALGYRLIARPERLLRKPNLAALIE